MKYCDWCCCSIIEGDYDSINGKSWHKNCFYIYHKYVMTGRLADYEKQRDAYAKKLKEE
jgi:hypothetical protein